MIQCLVCQEEQVRVIEPEAVAGVLHNPQVVLWVDLEAPTEAEGEFLYRVFNFHPLAIEDCLSPRLRSPKLDDYGSYLFLVAHGVDLYLPKTGLDTHEIDIFLGTNHLVTSHRTPSLSIQQVRDVCLQNASTMKGACILLHHILDPLVDNMLRPVEEQAGILSELKRDMLQKRKPSQLRTILELEERLLKVRWIVPREQRVLARLIQGRAPLVQPSTLIYFQDILDHLVRLEDTIGTLWAMAEGNLSLYLSMTANSTADFTKALSLIAAVFLPLTLVAGIYGMNFKNMPELEWEYGYFLVLAFILAVVGGMFTLYRRRHWI